jgi:fatty-acyl-CoA synthase
MTVIEFIRWAISAVAVVFRLIVVGIRIRLHSLLHSKGSFSYADVFESHCDQYPDQVQFIMAETGESVTKKEVDNLANQVAVWALNQGLKPFDSVALMMLNNLSFVSIWLGFAKIGMGTALVNTNLTGKPFAHSVETSLKSSDVKILIVDADLEVQLKTDLEELRQNGVKVLIWGTSMLASKDISQEIKLCSTQRPSKIHRSVIRECDPLLYIFTSGTTGLPKACKISQTRFLSGSYFYPYLCGLDRSDVIYSAMPLYHSAAGIIAAGGAIFALLGKRLPSWLFASK